MNIKLTVDGREVGLSKETLENLKEAFLKPKVWKPEKGDYYYCLLSNGDVTGTRWVDGHVDRTTYALGNIFKTMKEAEEHRNWLIFHADVKRWLEANPQDIDWDKGNQKYSIFYDHSEEILNSFLGYSGQLAFYYFKDKIQIDHFITDIGESRIKKYMFGVE